jgi:hypothetical protein
MRPRGRLPVHYFSQFGASPSPKLLAESCVAATRAILAPTEPTLEKEGRGPRKALKYSYILDQRNEAEARAHTQEFCYGVSSLLCSFMDTPTHQNQQHNITLMEIFGSITV